MISLIAGKGGEFYDTDKLDTKTVDMFPRNSSQRRFASIAKSLAMFRRVGVRIFS